MLASRQHQILQHLKVMYYQYETPAPQTEKVFLPILSYSNSLTTYMENILQVIPLHSHLCSYLSMITGHLILGTEWCNLNKNISHLSHPTDGKFTLDCI